MVCKQPAIISPIMVCKQPAIICCILFPPAFNPEELAPEVGETANAVEVGVGALTNAFEVLRTPVPFRTRAMAVSSGTASGSPSVPARRCSACKSSAENGNSRKCGRSRFSFSSSVLHAILIHSATCFATWEAARRSRAERDGPSARPRPARANL